MANLFLMMGIPGAGKSTLLKKFVNPQTSVVVSRDKIRFSIVAPDEPYFSHEDEVLVEFWKQINNELAAGHNVFVDQTSLTIKSRAYLLNHVTGYDKAILIWVNEDVGTCLKRNKNRMGTRAFVPSSTINRMAYQLTPPSLDEGFDLIIEYTTVSENGTYKVTYKGDEKLGKRMAAI